MVEKIVLKNLLKNEDYARRVLPFLKEEYFSEESDRIIFREGKNFIIKYNDLPSAETLLAEINALDGLHDSTVKEINKEVPELFDDKEESNLDWLIDASEKFCQDKALYLGIMQSIKIMDSKGDKSGLARGAIPQILADALGVSFNPNIGHDYFGDALNRYESYHEVKHRLPFDLEYFNKITKGGMPRKTLNVILAGTGVGKSLAMCHMAASYLNQGKNVLYITLELSEEEVGKRIDTNLMNITFDQLQDLSKDEYDRRSKTLKTKTNGTLIIKEYPTAGASSLHFENLLNELLLKKSFKPDVIFVDYINICLSSRIKPGGQANSYAYIKAIAEELRGLAVKSGVPLVTATQVNRTGFLSSDIELTDTSESFGLPATADFMIALIQTEDLEKLGQYLVKQLKNRYNSAILNKRFVIGVDKSKMRLFDVEGSAQNNIHDSGQVKDIPVMDVKNKFKKLKV